MIGTLRSFADGGRHGETNPETKRMASILLAKEDHLKGKSTPQEHLSFLLDHLGKETDPIIASTIISCVRVPLNDLKDGREAVELQLLDLSSSHPLESCRLQIKRLLASCCTSEKVVGAIREMWAKESDNSLTVNDYMSFACQLAIRLPDKADEIIRSQRKRLDGSDPARVFNKNNLDHFDFVSRAAMPDQAIRDSVFSELLTLRGRAVEPWAEEALGYLNHFLRDSSSVKYIRPGLDALLEVKANGDIFFPGKWCGALLGGHRSKEALGELNSFLKDNPDYPPLLKNKLLVAAYGLQRANGVKEL